MDISLEKIAQDIIEFRAGGDSSLFNPVSDASVATYVARSVKIDAEKLSRIRKSAYLVRMIQDIGPSFPSALIKIEKSVRSAQRAGAIRGGVYEMLFLSAAYNHSHTAQHLNSIAQLLKSDAHRLIREINHLEYETNKIGYCCDISLDIDKQAKRLEVNQGTMPGIIASMLFSSAYTRYGNPVRPGDDNELRLAQDLFAPLCDHEIASEAKTAMDYMRLVKKNSSTGSNRLGSLYAKYAASAKTSFQVPGTKAGADFFRSIMGNDVMVSSVMRQLLAQNFTFAKGNNNKTSCDDYCARTLDCLRFLTSEMKIPDIESCVVGAFQALIPTIGGNNNYFDEEHLPAIRNITNAFISLCGDQRAVWWSILHNEPSIKRAKESKLNKNSILLTVAKKLTPGCEQVKNLDMTLARLALLEFYTQSSLSIMEHSSSNGQEMMKQIYKLVEDTNVLMKMNGGTKRELLHDQLGL